MKYLLDTCVISEAAKPRPEPRVDAWLQTTPPDSLYLSVVTLGEIAGGVEAVRLRDAVRARKLDLWLARLRTDYAERIFEVDADIAERWGRLNGIARREGRPVQRSDNLLAATALTHGLILVTRNSKDFVGTGVAIFDPWAS